MADKPESGHQYRLTGGPGDPCIANGNTWAESEVCDSCVELMINGVRCHEQGCPNSSRTVCPNCGQWSRPPSNDCFNECRARGFVEDN